MKNLIVIMLICASVNIYAQDEPKFGVTLSGFVKNDFYLDTRQTVAAREGHFLLWPSPEALDPNGQDMNAKSNFNFLAIQSRLSVKITGPDALGAKTSGLIEGDFFAQMNQNINLLRLRHAFLKLNWTNTEILTGQYWNPLFVTGCFPGTVSFNTGTPLQSFARNPQIRLSHNIHKVKFILAALAQRDYACYGIDGPTSVYLRNSMIPDMHFQIHFENQNESTGLNILAGTGMAYKSIVPRLCAETGGIDYKVDERVNGLTYMAFAKVKIPQITSKIQFRYGENISDVLSISGFAVKNIEDPATGKQSYTPLRNITVWGEIHSNGELVQVGIFGGYLKNLGTKESMSDASNEVYGLATNIESLYRVSPRIILNTGKFRLAFEGEYTSATYGSGYDVDYKPSATSTVANMRFLFSTYLFF